MNITLTGRHVDISDAFRQSVETGLHEVMEKHNIDPIESSVILHKHGHMFNVDIHSHVSKNLNIRTSGEAGDAYAAFENCLDKMRTRIRRHKEWLDHHHKHHDVHVDHAPSYVMDASQPTSSTQNGDSREFSPAIIAEMKHEIPTLSVGEAVTLFDFQEESTYVFRNSKNGGVNVIYRRKDGNIGWVDPSLQ